MVINTSSTVNPTPNDWFGACLHVSRQRILIVRRLLFDRVKCFHFIAERKHFELVEHSFARVGLTSFHISRGARCFCSAVDFSQLLHTAHHRAASSARRQDLISGCQKNSN
jgi:hypothetical protein